MSHNVDMENIAHLIQEPSVQVQTAEEIATHEAAVTSQPKPVSAPQADETPAEAVTRLDLVIATLDPQLEKAIELVAKSVRNIVKAEAKVTLGNEKRVADGLAPEGFDSLAYWKHHSTVLPKYQAQVAELTDRLTTLRAERTKAQKTVARQAATAARKAAKEAATS